MAIWKSKTIGNNDLSAWISLRSWKKSKAASYSVSKKNGIKVYRAHTGQTAGRSIFLQEITSLGTSLSLQSNFTNSSWDHHFLHDCSPSEARSIFKSHMQTSASKPASTYVKTTKPTGKVANKYHDSNNVFIFSVSAPVLVR